MTVPLYLGVTEEELNSSQITGPPIEAPSERADEYTAGLILSELASRRRTIGRDDHAYAVSDNAMFWRVHHHHQDIVDWLFGELPQHVCGRCGEPLSRTDNRNRTGRSQSHHRLRRLSRGRSH